MKSYIVRTENITGRIQDFKTAIESLAKVTGAKLEIVPCLEIKTEDPNFGILLEKMTGKVITPEVVPASEPTRPEQKKSNVNKPNGTCPNCHKPGQLVKADGLCKPCHMQALKQAKKNECKKCGNKHRLLNGDGLCPNCTPLRLAENERIEMVVQAAKEREAVGMHTGEIPSKTRLVAVRKF